MHRGHKSIESKILHYKPKTVKWKQVESGLKSRINLYFSDTTGRPFNDIPLSSLLKIHKPVLPVSCTVL